MLYRYKISYITAYTETEMVLGSFITDSCINEVVDIFPHTRPRTRRDVCNVDELRSGISFVVYVMISNAAKFNFSLHNFGGVNLNSSCVLGLI